MGFKGEIGWKRRTEEGIRMEFYAHPEGSEWVFFQRSRRFEQWQRYEAPALEDWLELLDGVERRVTRKLLPPAEAARLRKTIRERFPEADLP